MTPTVVHYIDTGEFGGAERALLHLLRALDASRFRSVLFHPAAPGLQPLVDGARAAGVEVRTVPNLRGRRNSFRIPRFREQLAAERPALLHAHLNWPLACSAGILAASMAGIPPVATVQLFSGFPRASTIALQRRLVVRAVQRWIAVSPEVATSIEERLGVSASRIRTVYNGIDTLPFASAVRDARVRGEITRGRDAPVVLALARHDRQKGLDCLLRAASLLPEVSVAIAGDGPERAALDALARELDVADRVAFLGRRDDVPALLASADVFVLPSRLEGLPLSLLEALAAGRPVVASSIGGIVDVVRDGIEALLVPPDDPAALADAVRRVLHEPALADAIAHAGRMRVKTEFSAEGMARSVASIYDEVLSGPATATAGAG